MVVHTAWMFGVWAAARIVLLLCMRRDIDYPDALLKIVTDVEIHSLGIRWGWDLILMVAFAAVASVVQVRRRREVAVPVGVSTVVATALAIVLAGYPALTLSGRVRSPFGGVGRSLHESIAFAVAVTVVLAAAATFLFASEKHLKSTR